MFDTVVLNPLEVDLDYNNPRFSMFDFNSEEEIIKYLIDFEQIKELAFQILENGYNTIGERIIVLKRENAGKISYTVLEGNRRIASLKLLFQYISLLTSSERKKLEQLKPSLKDFEVSCDVVKEDTRDEALFKISAKHVDGIKTWSATDKRVFYHNLYTQYRKKGLSSDKALDKIKNITPEGKVAIRNAIQQLNYLTSVYNVTKNYKPDLKELAHLDTDVLVSRVLRPLIKELDLEFNDDFQLVAKNRKVYYEILGLLGKAVWVDKKLDTRVFSVQGQWNEIVKNDKVIPGLAGKITEYKEFEKNKVFKEESSKNNPISNDTKTTEDSVIDNKGISISCTHRNIVIKNNVIDSISENGKYDIAVNYAGETKHFQIFLNIEIDAHQEDYQFLFNQQWYDESLSKLSANPKYFKICGVIRNLQKYNSLSHNDDEYIILAFLLRALMEYTAKAYIDLFSIKKPADNLSSFITTVKGHLSDKGLLNKEEVKALKNTNDIETLNGLIHDYGATISSIDIKTTCSKYQKYFSVVFDRLSEGVNNG